MLSLQASGSCSWQSIAVKASALEGLRPRFRPMYAEANMGHPSREEGFVLCSNCSVGDDR